jgi:hypothetical protein
MNCKLTGYLFLLLLMMPCIGNAQILQRLLKVESDTAYVSEHDRDLTIRPFVEHSFNQFNFLNTRIRERFTYQPNSPLQAGLGVSYRIIGVGFGFALPGVNQYNKYGKGKITDFSTHFYLRRFNVDVFYQYYGGQHLKNPSEELTNYNVGQAYIRNDIYTKAVGMGIQFIAKPKTFSMEPFSFVHYQKKAAGSFIAGVQLIRTGIYGDSAIVPPNLQQPDLLNGFPLIKSLSYNATVNGGYAYTYVYHKHLFITGALTVGAGVSMSTLYRSNEGGHIRGAGLQVNALYRVLTGYNSEYFFAGLQFTGYTGYQSTPLENVKQQYNISRLNFTVAKRFKLKRKLLGFY